MRVENSYMISKIFDNEAEQTNFTHQLKKTNESIDHIPSIRSCISLMWDNNISHKFSIRYYPIESIALY